MNKKFLKNIHKTLVHFHKKSWNYKIFYENVPESCGYSSGIFSSFKISQDRKNLIFREKRFSKY